MISNPKREAALKLLAATRIWPSSYAPPLLRFLWRLGFDVPPPHFASFWRNALCSGAFFAVIWGLLMWFCFWLREGRSLFGALITAAAAGVFFGFWMAAYYARGKRKYNLPDWRDFNPTS
jgi:hypothetical protein